ncbi:unnamed protein product [Didymodactylos carnosus]|uniref:Uncharacterized protein n=1 Tax=Didymodactylos carnosus TaxID=1234261 RepID=A0A814SSJ3_9BILA|nr:unnamed protein product [Didymodactylos carnosus]CAF1604798.1 unnamed protein product [Didymodactylos carnosus]CAF3913416.1 unnamed protein product [Didymodactylos carnosus]CAF4415034.1 unnamed protein product [Didymodactylos carnosus]
MMSTSAKHALAALFIHSAPHQAKQYSFVDRIYRCLQASKDETSKYAVNNTIMNTTFMSMSTLRTEG